MEDKKSLVIVAFVAGFGLAAILLSLGGRLTVIKVGGIEIEMPTQTKSSPTVRLTESDDSFLGTWVAVDPDGSNQELSITGGNDMYDLSYLDDGASLCGLDDAGKPKFPATGTGKGKSRGNVLSVDLSLWCLDSSKQFLGTDHVDFTYDVSSDSLTDKFASGYPSCTWHRR